jgi:uncharacterized protein YjiS (DUF1127 family)
MSSNSIALKAGVLAAKSPLRLHAIDVAQKAWNDILRSRAQRVLATHLHSLDDRTLADIGLNRGQIDLFVSGRIRFESCI